MNNGPDLTDRWQADALTRGLAKISIDTYRWSMLYFEEFAVSQGCEIEDAARMVRFYPDSRDQSMITILFKTEVRRGELLSIETGDIKWRNQSILLNLRKKEAIELYFSMTRPPTSFN
jgi:integrase